MRTEKKLNERNNIKCETKRWIGSIFIMSELVCSIFCVKSIRHLIICGLFTLFFLVVVVVGCSVFFCLSFTNRINWWVNRCEWLINASIETTTYKFRHSFRVLYENTCFGWFQMRMLFTSPSSKHPSVSMFCSAVFCVVSIPVIHLIVNCFFLDGMINPYPKRSLRREREKMW